MQWTRKAVVVAIVGAYAAVWPAMIAGAFIGMLIDGSTGDSGEWDGLVGLIYGGFIGLMAAHIVWWIATWRLLRPRSSRGRIIGTVLGAPIAHLAVLVVFVSTGLVNLALVVAMLIVTSVVTAALAWWATGAADLAV